MRALLLRIFNLGVRPGTDPREARYIIIANASAFFAVLAGLAGLSSVAFTHEALQAIIAAAISICFGIVLAVAATGHTRAARLLLLAFAVALIFLAGLANPERSGSSLFSVVALAAVWLTSPPKGRALAWFGAALVIAGHIALKLIQFRGTELVVTRWINEAVAFSLMGAIVYFANRRAIADEDALMAERARSEELLRNMLPGAIVDRLKQSQGAIAQGHDEVTVLFADIVGFTPLSQTMTPHELVRLLNEVFSAFDDMARRHGLEKIKTIGDAYMVVGGVPTARADNAAAVGKMALEMRDTIARFHPGLQLRIGMHTGPVVAGVIGTAKFSYDLWGDTVNTAARMESHGEPGKIQLTAECRAALGDRFKLEERGTVQVKGKGPLQTYWLVS